MNVELAQSPPPTAQDEAPRRAIFLWLWVWFWRVTLVVSLGYAWHSFYVPSNNIVWATDYASAQQQAADSGKPIILFFTAKWCVPCRIMKRTVWADEQVEAMVNAEFTPVMIDVGDTEAAAAALEHYRVGPTPTTIITDAQGNVLEHVVGGIGKPDFLKMLATPRPSAADRSATKW